MVCLCMIFFAIAQLSRAEILNKGFNKLTSEFKQFKSLNISFSRSTKLFCASQCSKLQDQCFSFSFQKKNSYCELGSDLISSTTSRDLSIDIYYLHREDKLMTNVNVTTTCSNTWEKLSGTEGYIYSPYYPGNYNNNAFCSWIIEVPSGYNVTIRFLDVTIECNYDKVTIFDTPLSEVPLVEFSCTANPSPFTSTRTFRIEFRSDSTQTCTGFRALYKVNL